MSPVSEARRRHPRGIIVPLLLLSVVPVIVLGADPPVFAAGDLPGLTIGAIERFEGKALFGYIDGGAELFFEYGFTSLAVQHLDVHGIEFTLESYLMRDSLAALGIFSVSRGRCAPVDSLGLFSSQSAHQILWASSRVFVRLVDPAATASSEQIASQLARALNRQIHASPVQIPAPLLASGLPPQECLYVCGPLGLQNGFDSWSDRFAGLEAFHAFILPGETADGPVIAAQVEFADSAGCGRFIRRIRSRETPSPVLWRPTPMRVVTLEPAGQTRELEDRIQKTLISTQ